MKDEKKNYLTTDGIRLFILANILHAVDHDLLHLKFSEINLDVDTEYEGNKYVIKVDYQDKEIITLFFPLEAESVEDHYRVMMSTVMSVLDFLSVFAKQQKPVLKIVK